MAELELRRAGLTGRLQPLDLNIDHGERTVLLGRSGAGKSSLIGLCNGSLSPDQGRVLWRGHDLQCCRPTQLRQIGTLWQDLRLVEELTVLQNINTGASAVIHCSGACATCCSHWNTSLERHPPSRTSNALRDQRVAGLSGGERNGWRATGGSNRRWCWRMNRCLPLTRAWR